MCASDFLSLGVSDDYIATLIILIVLVLKLESLLYDGILIAVSSIKCQELSTFDVVFYIDNSMCVNTKYRVA